MYQPVLDNAAYQFYSLMQGPMGLQQQYPAATQAMMQQGAAMQQMLMANALGALQ